MSWLGGLELEEKVGSLWHRLVGERASWPSHPEAAMSLDQVRGALAVFFRGLGGDRGVQIASASAKGSGHRLSLRQRIGMEEERLVQASRDAVSLALPETIALFPEAGLNRDLYFWLAAYLAAAEAPQADADPLRADMAALDVARRTTAAVLERFPGLRPRHGRLCAAVLAARPARRLTRTEQAIEDRVVELLGGPVAIGGLPATAPPGYRPFLPVPLWGRTDLAASAPAAEPDDAGEPEGGGGESDDKRRAAERRNLDQSNRDDPMILNRFEKILAFADMVNVNRAADDTDEEDARKAADDLDTLTLSQHSRKAATRLKFDLDLPPQATDPTRLTGTHLYPEWDWRMRGYHRDHCQVVVAPAPEEGEAWVPDQAAQRRIRSVKRQFEALRTRPMILRGQADGQELDTDAVVRAHTDLKASGMGNERVWLQRRAIERDLAVTLLVDASLSTDAWIEGRRVLDVEKEALAVFCHGLAACGDSFAVQTFTSRKRGWVRVETVKGFDEPFGPAVMKRIGAIRPGWYTRIGAAVRHAAADLERRPNRHRLLLVLTDGKPNDVDHYEGRYGIEDTRKAVHDARARGLSVFGVTIDRKAQAYFPHLFGRGHYAIVHHLGQLSAALPRIYRQLVAA
ncbi:MAG: nitric oxide reductase activation protein NorD [Actinomycetota bacterium]